jgi:hypothetical protein
MFDLAAFHPSAPADYFRLGRGRDEIPTPHNSSEGDDETAILKSAFASSSEGHYMDDGLVSRESFINDAKEICLSRRRYENTVFNVPTRPRH